MTDLRKQPNKIYDDLMNEVTRELEEDNDYIDTNFKEDVAKKEKLFNRVFKNMFGKLLSKLQFKITVLWNGKELFTYIIPKN